MNKSIKEKKKTRKSPYYTINSLEKLEELFEISYDIPNREEFSSYIFTHPLRFTSYLIQQIKKHTSIAKQYLPDPREMNESGEEKPFCGIFPTKIPGLERMYLDRVILMPTSQCFAYCRFCFRKNYSHDVRDGDFGNPQDHFEKALNYIREDDRIKEVLITGGDPLIFPEKTLEIIQQLRKIPHLTGIRIGTRIFTSAPELITKNWIKPFQELNTYPSDSGPLTLDQCPISIATHINHPDELSKECIRALLLCTQNNIPLYNQTVLLKDINDEVNTMIELMRSLRQLNVEPYRIYHADPLKGGEHFRCTLDTFLQMKKDMRTLASGRIVPNFIVDTQIGKVEIGSDAKIISRENRTIWIKTPFTEQHFRSISEHWKKPEGCETSEDGSLIIPYEDIISSTNPQKMRKQHLHLHHSSLKILDTDLF